MCHNMTMRNGVTLCHQGLDSLPGFGAEGCDKLVTVLRILHLAEGFAHQSKRGLCDRFRIKRRRQRIGHQREQVALGCVHRFTGTP
jgi:hypothetical protein